MSFEAFADAQVAKAQEDGLFEDLPGKGVPLQNLSDAYDPLWWIKDLLEREGVGSPLPPSLEIRRTAELVMEKIDTLHSEAKVRDVIEKLNEQIRHVNRTTISGPPTTQAVLDVEAVIEKWRVGRAEDSPSPE